MVSHRRHTAARFRQDAPHLTAQPDRKNHYIQIPPDKTARSDNSQPACLLLIRSKTAPCHSLSTHQKVRNISIPSIPPNTHAHKISTRKKELYRTLICPVRLLSINSLFCFLIKDLYENGSEIPLSVPSSHAQIYRCLNLLPRSHHPP